MRIIVDADSCSKIRQIEEIAEEKGLPVMLFCDTAHQLYSDYSKIKRWLPEEMLPICRSIMNAK